MLLARWCPLKIQHKILAGLQFSSRDCLSLVLTPVRIYWTVSFNPKYEAKLFIGARCK
jgi:hypothetical protein